jgi:hypothetical protein
MAALGDPLAREAMTYIYGCAMPKAARMTLAIDGVSYTFKGGLGLAPAWGATGGSCDLSCQRWVTGCLLARTNYAGVSVPISIRGPHAALTVSSTEKRDYAAHEAAYYGNLFAETPELYACEGDDAIAGIAKARFCGVDNPDCPLVITGPCHDAACAKPAQSEACENRDAKLGYATACHTASFACGTWPDDASATFAEVITVYVQGTTCKLPGGCY